MLDNPAVSPDAALNTDLPPAGAVVHVWLFGGLAKFAVERPIVLAMANGFCAADVIDATAKRCGPDFLGVVMREPGQMTSCCKIFLDGWPVDDLNRPLKTNSDTAEWEMIVLTGEPGG